jgi:3-oxosteroid 1-dehydrogenase
MVSVMDNRWDHTTDVLVVGSGGGGMTAALMARDRGADALVIEKSSLYGGSTSMSGGSVWIPNNHLMKKAGLADSLEEALTYLKAVTAGRVSEERLRAYVKAAPEMVKYLEEKSHVRFQVVPGYSDYYPGLAGGKPGGGRTIEAAPFDARKLGRTRAELRPLPRQARVFGRMMATAYDAHRLLDSSMLGRIRAARIFALYLLNPFRSLAKTDTRLTLGNALAGRLRLSLADRHVPVWLNTSASHLIVDGGRVVGVEAQKAGQGVRIRSNKAVILAAGGFAHNKAMREEYQRQPITDAWTVASPADDGDGIQMGLELGASVEFMDDAWWMPTSVAPGEEMPIMSIVDRSLPGCIIVNKQGRRFTNEAAPYIDVVKSQYASHFRDGGAIPAHFLMDQRFRRRYPAGPMMPMSTPKRFISSGYLKVADTLEGLAEKCGIDPVGLVAEVKKFNEYAAAGRDLDFKKGDTAIDRFYADASVKPNPCLGPLDKPPFCAIELWPGDLGTKGGLVTDDHARVLRQDGSPIDGLYATGNCSASVMGNSYAGAGATIGPSMAFGYIAALQAVER